MSDNKRALQFNKAFGYMMQKGEENKVKQWLTLTMERY
jgi:hypothetical protein